MKTLTLSCLALVACCATQLHAQIILGSFYDSGGESQSINTVSDFTAAGVKGTGGAALSNSDQVTGFDFTPLTDTNGFGNSTYTSGGLTLSPRSNYFTRGSGVYQSVAFGATTSLSGLSAVLKPYTKYTLDIFSQTIFGGTQNVGYTYGTQTGSMTGVANDAVVSFNIETGLTPTDSVSFMTSDPSSGYGGVTGFAIVSQGAVPEPSTYAFLLAGLCGLALAAKFRRNQI